jgi:hypothetical protein
VNKEDNAAKSRGMMIPLVNNESELPLYEARLIISMMTPVCRG